MTEEFLYFLWQHKLLDKDLITTTGEKLLIVNPGTRNFDSGPDFFNARVKLDGTEWAGNVEIHVRASDWYRHKHQHDKLYQSIILHVVYLEDKTIKRNNGSVIPVLEVHKKFNSNYLQRYEELIRNRNWIPCQHLIHKVNRIIVYNLLDRLLAERLEKRSYEINQRLQRNNNDWEESFYQQLAKNMGFKVNALPFELLARSLPAQIISKHKNNLKQIEALLFGQAGLLNGRHRTAYYLKLKSEYDFLRIKYNLYPIDPSLWKFLRMRPSNFPTIRIAQFAVLMQKASFLFSRLLEMDKISDFEMMLNTEASDFWDYHYTFAKRSKKSVKKMGKTAIHLICLNTMIPFLYTYGKNNKEQVFVDRSFKLLQQLPGEQNTIITHWKDLGMEVQCAYNTQALLELKKFYCSRKKCLQCAIGNYLLTE